MGAPSQLSLFKGHNQRGTVTLATGSEFELQCMVVDVLDRWGTRGWKWSHFPSGEYRPWGTGKRLERMGLKRGWPDLVLLSPYPPKLHQLELKRPGEKLTDDQIDHQAFCVGNGYVYAVAFSFKEALAILKDWGAVRASVSA
jgi:VRR-NUC domain-containing protein